MARNLRLSVRTPQWNVSLVTFSWESNQAWRAETQRKDHVDAVASFCEMGMPELVLKSRATAGKHELMVREERCHWRSAETIGRAQASERHFRSNDHCSNVWWELVEVDRACREDRTRSSPYAPVSELQEKRREFDWGCSIHKSLTVSKQSRGRGFFQKYQ